MEFRIFLQISKAKPFKYNNLDGNTQTRMPDYE